jgi:hypothetical protein
MRWTGSASTSLTRSGPPESGPFTGGRFLEGTAGQYQAPPEATLRSWAVMWRPSSLAR